MRKVLYLAGPGDVVRTFQAWLRGEGDALELAGTYSGQFFDVVRRLSAQGRVVSMHDRRDDLMEGAFAAENRPQPSPSAGGVWYYVHRLRYELVQVIDAIRWGADVIIVTTPVHWWLFALPRVCGIRVVPTVHCTFWTGQDPPRNGAAKQVLRWMTGWFWRHGPSETMCISGEVARQIRLIAGRPRGELHVCTPAFDRAVFNGLPAPERDPARVLYAGRIERVKGVWDMLDAAAALDAKLPGRVRWTVCGGGQDLDALRAAAQERGLSAVFECPGHTDQRTLRRLLGESSLVVAPTQRGFNEGLNKSVVEGALAGRPVITTTVVPARDLVGEAAVVIEPDSATALAAAVERLVTEDGTWQRHRAGAAGFAERFFAEDRTWGATLERILRRRLDERNASAAAPVASEPC